MFSILPPEVISDHIFPFLHVNDLLRLRRVSKLSKNLAEDYLRLHATSKRVICMDVDEERNEYLTNFLTLTYPVNLTRFEFWNEDNSSWDREEMQTFVDRYGGSITHLEIGLLYIPIESPATVTFFEGFSNLEELRIGFLEESKSDEEKGPHVEEPAPDLNLPSTFKRIKHLNVETYSCGLQLLRNFLNECSNHLDRVSLPAGCSPNLFDWVRRIVERRHRENPDNPNLKYLDLKEVLESIFDDVNADTYARSLYQLVTTCSTHNVKLQHVDARLIEAMMKLDTPDRGLHEHKISRCVVSTINLTRSVFHLELPVLEKIDIRWTSVCSMPDGDFQRQSWSNLKELKVYVNSEFLAEDGAGLVERVGVSRLFEFLFHGLRRQNLESLDLFFETDHQILPHPNTTSVCSSCPNLKKLYIYKWPGCNGDIAQLWGNLPRLENVTFEWCDTLGDAAFLGEDDARPAIWKATRLKSLKLKRLNEMPGITDNLFKSALRHMPLKYLYLESWHPVSSFTLAGLKSLLGGKFAETVEKFPLKGKIKLEGVTDEQLAELEGKFRSAQM